MSTKRVWFASIVVMAALFALALAPATAGAVDLTNQQCLVCHGTDGTPGDMDFEVGAVNKATACRTCHLDSLAGTHPYHNGGGNCGAVCHTGWGDSLIANVPTAVYAYGAFASPSSQDTTAGILHIIHAKPRWMSSLKLNGDDCGRCHAVASCNACHNGTPAPAATHGMHGDTSAGFVATTSPIAPWNGDLATGPAKLSGASLRCGGAACHDIDGTGDAAPVMMDNFSHGAYPESGYVDTTVNLAGSWTTKYGSAYTGGQQILSNYTSATAEVTFNGERVVLVGDRDPYRGIAEIYVDNVLQGTVDFYNGTTKQQDPVWTSGALTAGNHTLKIRVTGNRHASARGAFVPFDQLKVYVVSPGSVAPNCASCHSSEAVSQGDNHFGMPIVLEFSHEATAVATQVYNTGYGNYTCDQCHVMTGNSALRTEHGRASTNWISGVTNSCGVCHSLYSTPASNYASTTIYPSPYWVPNQGCDYDEPTAPGCHVAPRDRHGAVASKHTTVTTGPSATCSSCHAGDLRAVHNNSIPGNGYLETNGCLACHGTSKYPSTNNCAAAGCHVATGITSVDTHGYDAVKHTAATFTRAFQDSAELDDGGVECNVCHTATLNTAHAEAPAVGCTTGGAGGLGCHEDTAYNSKAVAAGGWTPEKCVTCHDYSTKVSHDSTATPHLVTSNGCAGSSAGCHPSNDLWKMHAQAQGGGAPKYQSCSSANTTGTADPYVCHVATAKDDRPTPAPVANSCGSTSTGCHQEINLATHPGGFAHVYTNVSYYSGASETGCTNQAGCHNQEGAATTDFAALYHPTSGCVSGPCHTSGSWSKDAPADDCQTCHNGSYTGAANRASLTASPTAGGHYSETTHTATGMTGSLIPTGGALGATCNQCHSPSVGGVRNGLANQHTQISVAGSPYGAALSCGECHGDNRSRGASEVAGNWATDTCVDCHTATASSKFDHATKMPEVPEVTTSCGSTGTNCHVSTDLHVLHKGASGGGCFLTGCHNSSQQANVPTAKSCGVGGACHATYTATTHTHGLGGDAAKHQPTNSTQASDTSYFGTACGACHDIRNNSASLTLEHTATTSAKSTVAGNNCRNCHNNAASTTTIANNWSAKDSTTACQACHTGGLAIHATENAATHTVTSTGCSSSGTGCHNGADLSDVGAVNVVNTNIHSSCLRCHDRTASNGNAAYNPANKTCGDGRNCHATAGQYNTTTYVHNGLGGLANGNDVDHHTATAGSMASVITSGSTSTACSVCHSSGLERSHATTLATNNLGSGNGAWTNTCTGCHNNNIAPIANSDDQVKAGWSTDVCSDCHATYHDTIGSANHTASSTQGCANSGANCHPTADLVTLHNKTATGCQVTGCHTTSVKDGRPAVANKTCGSGGVCHTSYTNSSTHAFTHLNSAETTAHAPTNGNTVQANAVMTTSAGNYTCTQCHIVTRADGGLMSLEHSSTFSAKSTSTDVCRNCHNNSGSTAAITSNWSQKDTTTACAQCHTGSLAIHADENVATHTVTNTGCGASGIGCHNTGNIASTGTTATVANNVIHLSCMRCHDRASATTTWTAPMIGTAGNLKYNPGVKTCGGATGCHTSASYSNTTYFHRIGRSDTASGTDAKHLDSVMTGTLGTGANNTCASCHSGTLAPSHNTTMTGWANSCTGCHNSALATNIAPTEVKANWTNNDCLDCHTAGASATKVPNWHSKWGTASHVGTTANGNTCDEACHASYTTLDLADIHDGRPAGCAVTGCHSVDKAMTASPTCGGVGATCHSDKTDGNHGVSTGGSQCYQCHGELQQYMEDGTGAKTGSSRTTVYHHVVGSATSDGDTATVGGTGAYPTSATDVYCISCHADHNYFNASVGANFRTNIASTSVNATNTDYVNSAGNGYGICVSCHTTSRAKDMTNQKPGSGTENVPAVSGAQYAGGTHQYSVATTYTKDGTGFRADCSKCHDDENSGGRNSRQMATHYSAEKRLLAILGATIVTGDEAQENACFKCHTGDTAGTDGYGVRAMTQASRRIQTVFGKTSTHPVLTGGTATLECQSCHNTHLSTTLTETVDPNNTYNRLSYTTDADTTVFCLRCHDGNVPAKQVDGAVYVPATITINPVNAGLVNKTAYAARGHWTPGAANSTTNSIGAAETASCADCHDQHGSAAPKLLGVYNPASNVNTIGAVTITGNNNDVCRGCHTSASTGYGAATASRDASGYPIDGTWPGSTVASTALNAVTHAGNPHNAANVVWPGTSYASGDCKNCHDVHGTANTFDALRGTPATSAYTPADQEFCFTCHGGAGPAVRDIEQYYPLTMGGDSTADNAGHNIQTPGALLPVGRGMPCYMCHNPHGSANQYGLTIVTMSGGTTITVGDGAGEINMDPTSASRATNVRNFCFTCHTTADGSSGWNGSAMTSVTSGNVLGINRITYDTTNKRGLKLPTNIAEHFYGSVVSCYDCHGNDYTTNVSYNAHNPSPGVSTGGRNCYDCHSSYLAYMEDGTGSRVGGSRTTAYHHVMGDGTINANGQGDYPFAQGAYPTSLTNVFCLSCHVDHSLFNANKGSNLRTTMTGTSATATNTDFNAATQTGVCQSCHSAIKTKDNANQKPNTVGSSTVPSISASAFAGGAHNYNVPSTFGSSTYNANCVKCHSDETLKQYQTSTQKFAVHWSSEVHILQSLGAAINGSGEAQENHCFECHSTDLNPYGATGKDGHNIGSMSTTATAIKGMFSLNSRHPVDTTVNVECQNCHNVHHSTLATETSNPDNTYSTLAFNTPADQATYCLKCHDGATPVTTINATTYIPTTVTVDATDTTRVNKSTYAVRGHWSAGASGSTTNSISAAETMACGKCHDNHGSAAPKLLGSRVVNAGVNKIFGTSKTTTITANNYEVCDTCHASASTGYPATASHNASGYPSDGRWPGMTQYNDATNGIHRVGRANVVYPGTTYATGECNNCHDVHGTANTYDDLRSTYSSSNYALCFDCHDGSPSTINIKQFYPVAAGGTSADANSGHRIKNAGGILPAGNAMPCYGCHNTHGSISADGLQVLTQVAANTTITIGGSTNAYNLGSATGVRNFCFSCHTTSDTNAGWNGTGMAAVVTGAKVFGLDRISTSYRLRLPVTSGHAAADAQSCYQCHGNVYTAGGTNVHNPGAGGGTGGGACDGCHSNYSAMVASTTVYHHVLDSTGTPYAAPAAGAYSTSESQLQCVSCHVDHNYFSSNKATNLRTNIVSSTVNATNTDFVDAAAGGAGAGYGICVSCHDTRITKDKVGQKTNGATVTPVIDGALYDASAHDYSINASFGANVFRANCSKCHDDENDAASKMTDTYKIGTHYSSSSGIARALGATITDNGNGHTVEENLCYKCHTGTGAGNDGYGQKAMTARARNIMTSQSQTYRHSITSATTDARHKADEYDSAPTSVLGSAAVPGWFGTGNAQRHSECEDCHNPHVAKSNPATEFPDLANPRGSSAVTVSPANAGVWGVNIASAYSTATNGDWNGSSATSGTVVYPRYSKIATSAYEWQFCLKCHSRYAWGNQTTPTVPSGGARLTPGVSDMTDVGRDFDPSNHAYHPLFKIGKNQPPVTANTNWSNTGTLRRSVGVGTNIGLSNTFTDGWFATSRVTCSDCHGNSTWGATVARGVHGSSRRWLMRGVNTGIKTTKEGGAVITNSAVTASAYCMNCHRTDVYGNGSTEPAAGPTVLGRYSHTSTNGGCWSLETNMNAACNQCHSWNNTNTMGQAGMYNGGGHGTSQVGSSTYTNVTDGQGRRALGFRFCNGAAWDDHQYANVSGTIGCNTIANGNSYSSCTDHGTGRDGGNPNYYY